MILELTEILHNSSPIIVALVGITIGFQHALEPDHIASITTQVVKMKKTKNSSYGFIKNSLRTSVLGAMWGAGHTSTILILGILVAGFSLTIPEKIFNGLELGVGIMLIYLASTMILKKKSLTKHIHPHTHDNGITHIHAHTHKKNHVHGHRSYLIGCIHGLAGTGAIVVLISSTLPSFDSSLSFILLFCFGSMIGMSLVSGLIGTPLAILSKKPKMFNLLRYSICAVTTVIGVSIIYEMIILQKLFLI